MMFTLPWMTSSHAIWPVPWKKHLASVMSYGLLPAGLLLGVAETTIWPEAEAAFVVRDLEDLVVVGFMGPNPRLRDCACVDETPGRLKLAARGADSFALLQRPFDAGREDLVLIQRMRVIPFILDNVQEGGVGRPLGVLALARRQEKRW